MGSYMGDISNLGSIGSGNQLPADLKVKSKSDSMGLDMTSFLKLMVAELTNQSIDRRRTPRICSTRWCRCRWCRLW